MYKLIGQNLVKRLTDGAYIPFADGNRDYEDYKQWLSEGNTPEPEFTAEELAQKELQTKITEASLYLKETDWVDSYKLRHDLGLELIPEDSSKWVIINKRAEYVEYLRGVK